MPKQSRIDMLFVLIVFCVFAISALASLTLGASVYKSALEQSQSRYGDRISLFYIWTKIKNSDEYGRVYVDNFNGVPALVLEEDIFGEHYNTYIYYHDGWIKELFGDANFEYTLADGQAILNLGENVLRFEQLSCDIIRVSDSRDSLIISPRTKKVSS